MSDQAGAAMETLGIIMIPLGSILLIAAFLIDLLFYHHTLYDTAIRALPFVFVIVFGLFMLGMGLASQRAYWRGE